MRHEQIRVLVADSSQARMFSADTPLGELHEDQDFVNTDLVSRDQDVLADRPGRAYDSAGKGRHAMELRTSPKSNAQHRFAGRLAERLERDRAAGRFERLGLVADSTMLGALRQSLSASTRRKLVFEIDKNLVKFDAAEVRAHLPKKLFDTFG